jgi:pantoate--beta-alanine ligase
MEQGRPKAGAIALARSTLSPLAIPDYFDVVDAQTFEPLEELRTPAFIVGAARLGSTRLLDNIYIGSPA